MRCVSCLKNVPQVRGLGLEPRCLNCQRAEATETVDACLRRGWEAQVVTVRGRLRVSVNTPIGDVTVHDRDDLEFLDADVAA